VSIGGHIQLVR